MTEEPAAHELSGPWRAHESSSDLLRVATASDFDDGDWPEITVPGHWRRNPAFASTDGPVLYRHRFTAPPLERGRRRFLTLGGTFYFADVFLDGDYLGTGEGYFTPRRYEISEQAGVSREGVEHALAIEVTSPPQRERSRRRTITGVLSGGDDVDPEWNPGGLWRPVTWHDTGPVEIARLRVLCADATETRARLLVDATLDPGPRPARTPLPAVVRLTITGPDGAALASTTRDVTLAAGPNRLRWPIDIEDPPRWWPWRLGEQPRCNVLVTVECDGVPSDARQVHSALREVRMRGWQLFVNGERLFVTGAVQGPTRLALADATPEEIRRDVDLARTANLDLVRLHAHVARPELYDAADAAGLLLWQDFPLQWGYGRGVRRPANRQAREMVDVLGHHPSIAIWCAHDDPLSVDLRPGTDPSNVRLLGAFASMMLPTWNKSVLDRSVAHTLHKADPTRPVDRHSGVLPGPTTLGTDTHVSFGWVHGEADGLAPALRVLPSLGRFVSELGVPAVPATADFMEPERWPDLDWTRLEARHSYDRARFDRHVPPAAFESFAAWRAATQEYQAAVVQLQVEDLRRLAHRPTGGFCVRGFADSHPAVTAAVLDHTRAPKLGFLALRDACRTVLPMLEPREGLVHVSSLARAPVAGAQVEVVVDGHVHRFTGDIAPDGVTFVGRVGAVRGARRVTATLRHPDLGQVRNDYERVLEWLDIIAAR